MGFLVHLLHVPLLGAGVGLTIWLLEQRAKRKQPKHKDAPAPFRTLLRTAVYSKLAYQSPRDFDAALVQSCSAQAQQILLIPKERQFYDSSLDTTVKEDTQAYMWVCAEEKTLFVVFRGTSSKADMMADLDLFTVAWPHDAEVKARVHRGFYEQFQAVEVPLDKGVAAHMAGVDKIVCCGHSLGAALATIAAAHYAHKYPKLAVSCFTFGSPRVGNKAFVHLFHEKVPEHWRVFSRRDPVPMIPPSGNFHHVMGHGVCCDADRDDSTLDLRVKHYDSRFLVTRLFRSLFNLRYRGGIAADHDMGRYIRKLEANTFAPLTAAAGAGAGLDIEQS